MPITVGDFGITAVSTSSPPDKPSIELAAALELPAELAAAVRSCAELASAFERHSEFVVATSPCAALVATFELRAEAAVTARPFAELTTALELRFELAVAAKSCTEPPGCATSSPDRPGLQAYWP